MTFSEETLMAYADNELDAQTRSAVEAAMASDPELARRVAQHKALRSKLRVAFDRVLDEPTPQRLVDAARGAPAVRREGNVVPLRRKPPRNLWSQWAAVAASLVIGVIIGQVVLSRGPGAGPIIARDGKLIANGALASALTSQLTSENGQGPVHIGVSFEARSGTDCRTFILQASQALAGLACRDHDDWHVRVLAQIAAQPQGNGSLRQAGSEMPKSVMQAVDDNIVGNAFDAEAEAAARKNDWESVHSPSS